MTLRKPTDQLPKIRATALVGTTRLFLRSKGEVQLLKLLSDAGGNWIDPKNSGVRGATLSKHAAALRAKYSLPVESRSIPDGAKFFNVHRLRRPIAIVEGAPADV